MKKGLVFVSIAGLLGITIAVCKIWVIISFILYLAKDHPFNWTVFWTGIMSIVALIILWVLAVIVRTKDEKKVHFNYDERPKSNFAKRLEEAVRLQEEHAKNKK